MYQNKIMTNTKENNQIQVRTAVRNILNKAKEAGEKLPSLRAIRAAVGRGSMTTISDIIHEWQLEQAHTNSKFPEGFSEATTKALGETVWNLILPVLQEQTGAIEAEAASRIEIEKTSAAKIREAAEEVLAEAKAKEEAFIEMQKKVAELMATNAEQLGALREARAVIGQLQVANEELLKKFNEASTAAAAAQAKLDMLPLIDPKHLSELPK